MNSQKLLLLAGQAVDGAGLGRHGRPRAGRAQSFREHRPYMPGDDLRHVDWHAVARKDALYVKVYEDESPVRLELVVDASGSMAYADKAEAAWVLAAAVAQAALAGGDEVGLWALGAPAAPAFGAAPVRRLVAPAGGRGHLARIAQALAQTEAAGTTPLVPGLLALGHSLRRRCQVVLVSDGLSWDAALPDAVQDVVARGHDVTLVQLWHADEATLPDYGSVAWRGLEHEGERLADSEAARAGYARQWAQLRANMARLAQRPHVALVQGLTSHPAQDLLRQVLHAHGRPGRRLGAT